MEHLKWTKWTIGTARYELSKFGYTLLTTLPDTEYLPVTLHFDTLCDEKHEYRTTIVNFVRNYRCKHSANEKRKKTCLEKYGVENPMQSEEFKQKHRDTCLERYGVESPLQSEEIRQKGKETLLRKYGVKNPFQSEEIKQKIAQRNLDKYGVEYPMRNEDIKEKFRQTCLRRHGVKYPFQSEDIKEKFKQTNILKYGVKYPIQHEDFKEKRVKTCLDRYGVDHPMQHPEIMAKWISSAYKRKEYIFPSGTKVLVQGYEPFGLDFLLLNGIPESEIRVGPTKRTSYSICQHEWKKCEILSGCPYSTR